METLHALDFISLLLSKHAARQAETSISPFLKEAVPLGSLSVDQVNPPPKSDSAKQDVSTVSRGWRVQNFNTASTKLLKAASRLETEVNSETRYWNEVVAVKAKGWKICRLPRDRQALGVQYGFLEATPIFRDRGLASLRRAEDGSLVLDKGLVPAGARFVRVRVKHGSEFSSSTRPCKLASLGEGEPVEQQILQARDSVFEEELFHELVREARAMAGSGVTTRQNLIQVPAADDLEILMDLVDDDDVDDNETGPDKWLANGLAHSIRLLLAFAHRQNLRRRTQVPPPLTPKRRPMPEYYLLRPALAYLQHLSQVRWLETFMNDIFGVLRSSGLNVPQHTANQFTTRAPISTLSLEALVGKFLTPVESVFRGDLMTAGSSFTVTVRTNLSGSASGTHFDIAFTFPAFPDLKSPGRLGLREQVESAVSHLLLLDVVSSISGKELPAGEAGLSRTWEPTYPHLGEMLLPSNNPEKHTKLKIMLSRQGLDVSSYVVRSIDGLGRGQGELQSSRRAPQIWKSSTDQSPVMDFVTAAAAN